MFERFNDADLLALIEDESDSKASLSLRAKLAGDEQAIAMLERMRQDRALLRSTPEPAMPVDLLAALEPLLARPMLIQTPGTDRRRRHRLQRQLRWAAAGLAALLALAAGTGAWLSWSQRSTQLDSDREIASVDKMTPPAPGIDLAGSAVVVETWPPEGATIHHRLPLHGADVTVPLAGPHEGNRPLIAAGQGGPGAGGPNGAAAGLQSNVNSSRGELIASPFALVVDSDDAARVTEAIRLVVRDLGQDSALVRNMTVAESDPLVAGAGADTTSGSAKARPRAGSTDSRAGGGGSSSGGGGDRLLEGSHELQPPRDQQVEFSMRGAQLTISVPLDRLDTVLARLSVLRGRLTSVQSLSPAGKDSETRPATLESQWLAEIGLIRDSIGPMEQKDAPAGRVLLMPVVIREKK